MSLWAGRAFYKGLGKGVYEVARDRLERWPTPHARTGTLTATPVRTPAPPHSPVRPRARTATLTGARTAAPVPPHSPNTPRTNEFRNFPTGSSSPASAAKSPSRG